MLKKLAISADSRKHFLDDNLSFSKYYTDYYIKLIRRKNVLTEDESLLILKSQTKCVLMQVIGFVGFLCIAKRYFKMTQALDFSNSNFSLFDNIHYYLGGIGSLWISNKIGEYIYCRDLKFLVYKYSLVGKEQYMDSELNRVILESYYDPDHK